ncbi:MAG: Wzz/FepE/Etk N-terminal domain-containing protein [Acholeplasmataceae bacterium]|nr:Wzz/FepE/Etk N-terminal domain-containing protein [Acholeplasmataceae bacterium]
MNNEQLEQTNEISLIDLIKILRSNIILIMIGVIIFGTVAAIYAFAVASPKYKSNAYVMVQVQVEGSSGNSFDLLNAQRLMATAADLISMPIVLEKVINDLDLEMSTGQLKSNLSISSSTTSYFINVSYLSEDPLESKMIVNAVIDAAIDFANNNVAILEDNIIRTSTANNGVYDSPNKVLYVVIGIMLGGIVGVGIAFLKEMLNNTFRTKEQLELAFGIQVLGVIPEFEVKEQKHE